MVHPAADTEGRGAVPGRMGGVICLVLVTLLAAACGKEQTASQSGSLAELPSASAVKEIVAVGNIVADDYGITLPNFCYTTDNASFWSVQLAVATGETDPGFKTILRIDLPKSDASLALPSGRIFSLEAGGPYDRFPGTVTVFNGEWSTLKTVETGTLHFSAPAQGQGTRTIIFDLGFADYDSAERPVPRYQLKGDFTTEGVPGAQRLTCGGTGDGRGGEALYRDKCSRCHSLGAYLSVGNSVSDLRLRGGELPFCFPGTVPEHQQINLDAASLWRLRVALNAW